jgi:hypothetical protein
MDRAATDALHRDMQCVGEYTQVIKTIPSGTGVNSIYIPYGRNVTETRHRRAARLDTFNTMGRRETKETCILLEEGRVVVFRNKIHSIVSHFRCRTRKASVSAGSDVSIKILSRNKMSQCGLSGYPSNN